MKFKVAIPKLIRFVLVGGINTIIDLGILNILIAVFGLAQPFLFSIYKGISFVCALLNSYFMNKHFTFEVRETQKRTFYLFVFFSLAGFLVNVITASFLFDRLSASQTFLNPHILATISGIFGTIFGLMVNYLSYNYLVFK